MSDLSRECQTFIDGISHPNEKVLAQEIIEGKKMGEFSVGFDQAQVDAMTDRLKGGGCLDPKPTEPVSGATPEATEEDTTDTEGEDNAEAPKTDEATPEATQGAMPEATPEAGATATPEATPEATANTGTEEKKNDTSV